MPVSAYQPDLRQSWHPRGEAAARRWKEVTLEDISEAERKEIYLDLTEFCKLDTLAMVKIHKELAKFCL